jgi:uroporphyrinogen-III decarboxylase
MDDGWPLIVDCQNYLEMAWLGATVDYDRDEPHTPPFLSDERKNAFVEAEPPGAFDGIGQHVLETYEHFRDLRRTGWSHAGKGIGTVSMPFNTTGTDGPFTIACGIRGMAEFLLDMVEDPAFAHALLDWTTEAVIRRIRAVRAYLGEPTLLPSYGCADDSIVLLSIDMYREFVLPCHRRILDGLTEPGGFRSMHLCGDAQRFFPVLQRELGVMQFDTGFPIDFARLYDELLPETRILGGPSIALLRDGTRVQVEAEVTRILRSGVLEKSRGFILREANSLAPRTPLENVNAIFRTCLREGVYPRGGPA